MLRGQCCQVIYFPRVQTLAMRISFQFYVCLSSAAKKAVFCRQIIQSPQSQFPSVPVSLWNSVLLNGALLGDRDFFFFLNGMQLTC